MIVDPKWIEAAKKIPPRTNKDWEQYVKDRDNRNGIPK